MSHGPLGLALQPIVSDQYLMKTTTIYLSCLLTATLALPATGEKVAFDSLPNHLKQKIQAHSGSSRIEDIDHETRNGQKIYEVGFKQNGQHKELVFNEQGELLNPDGSRAVPWPAAGTEAPNTKTNLSSKPVALGAGYKIQWEKLPQSVRTGFYNHAPGVRVEDIEGGTWNGQTVYQFAFKDQNNKHVEVQVNQQGQILHDPRLATTTSAAQPAKSALAQRPIPLSAGFKIPWEKLPEETRSSFLRHATGMKIEDIEGGTWNGMTIYQFGFKDQNNKHVEIQIDQRGNLLHDARQTGSNSK